MCYVLPHQSLALRSASEGRFRCCVWHDMDEAMVVGWVSDVRMHEVCNRMPKTQQRSRKAWWGWTSLLYSQAQSRLTMCRSMTKAAEGPRECLSFIMKRPGRSDRPFCHTHRGAQGPRALAWPDLIPLRRSMGVISGLTSFATLTAFTVLDCIAPASTHILFFSPWWSFVPIER